MSVDLSQFHQVFFEESYEGLDVMESALLNIDISNLDSEAINEIFRAAHSIKGGSGTFGFNEIAEFTHVVETLLDLIRSDQFVMEVDHVDLFLKSVDCIRTMINELEAGQSCETKLADELRVQFNALLEGGSETAENCESPSEETDEGSDGWTIYFKPDADVLRTGNDPVRMFRELSELGEVEVSSVVDELPELGSLDPEACYLAWNIVLKGDAERAQIDEVFEWVVDDSDIRIEKIDSQASEESEVNAEAAEPAVVAEAAVGVSAVKTEDVPASKSSVESSASVEKASKAPAPVKKESKPESVSIRVGTDKIDSLINMVGELVITQSMLNELGKDFTVDMMPKLMEGLEQLSLHTRELQESVMRIRMLPISFAFSRFPRLVHDISKSLEKKVELVLLGEQTELDKTVMERIGDPLVHLVRNSLDHGLESPEARLAAGKDETGKITLNAFHQGGNIVIQIIDDGAGLNEDRILSKAIENGLVSPNDHLEPEQIHDLIFQPGFSTAAEVTDISGRGVGMDVVRRNIQDLNGSVEVESTPGKGSMFSIRLPLTLAILDGQLIRVGQQVYIFPLVSIVESIES
ncbi:chemotaxis protein CheA, partial [Oleiphilus sp. HI0043]|uniref:chemotaxis protein CheA n=3 Tax=Oleiphilus TaxID=141450 RepID=UPI0007C37655